MTALDNVAARNTVERISHMYMRPMIDGGTEGLEGNQESFSPLKTAEYLPSCVKLFFLEPSNIL